MNGKKPGVVGYVRRGEMIRYFSEAEDEEITEQRMLGFSLGTIAKNVGRARSSVMMRLRTLAIKAEAGDV